MIIVFTIASYHVTELMGSNSPVRLYMYDSDSNYRGYIEFIQNYAGANNYVLHSNGIINAFLSLDKLHATLDIMRFEKPVYFALNDQHNLAWLSTGEEPTGEEETP